jgi:hypothetical protein
LKAGVELVSLFDLEHGGAVPPKRQLAFNGLRGVVSLTIVLFTILQPGVPERRDFMTV